jgi:hypothetical protein
MESLGYADTAINYLVPADADGLSDLGVAGICGSGRAFPAATSGICAGCRVARIASRAGYARDLDGLAAGSFGRA